jgi:signal transduction histidine kinase
LLTRAVQNLVDNAIRYTPMGGEVAMRWWAEGDKIIFSVADTGPGIASHDLAHIFQPLYRGEESRNRETGGVGIGLAIAQRIIAAHGGSLSVANRPDGGAVFTVSLPATHITAPAMPAKIAGMAPSPSSDT